MGFKQYFETVTLGAFSLKNSHKRRRFFELVERLPLPFLLLHFTLVSAALFTPVMYRIGTLAPYDFFSRLGGGDFPAGAALPPELAAALAGGDSDVTGDFNGSLRQSGYARRVILPALGAAAGIVLVLQTFFFAIGALCVKGRSVLTGTLPLRVCCAVLLFSATLPAALCALAGFALPAVHIVIFNLAAILAGFSRIQPGAPAPGAAAGS